MPDFDLKYRLVPGPLESRVSGDEVIILNPASGAYFSLDGVGDLVWRQLRAGPRSLDEIVDAVRSEYEVDAPTCRGDVRSLLEELTEAGLVTTDA